MLAVLKFLHLCAIDALDFLLDELCGEKYFAIGFSFFPPFIGFFVFCINIIYLKIIFQI